MRPFMKLSHVSARLSHQKLCSGVSRTVDLTRRMVCLDVDPARGLIDEPVRIRVRGLQPRQPITVAAALQDDGPVFRGVGHYLAGTDGCVDLNENSSTGGTYKGVMPMGLFSCMVPEGGYESGYRMRKKDIQEPHRISVAVLGGHQNPDEAGLKTLLQRMKDGQSEDEAGLSCLATQLIERHYMGEDVKRVLVRHGRIRGALFIPKGGGSVRSPGVIDLYGTTGGLAEYRAAMLASRGFTVLALAYFNYDDLPKKNDPLDLHYFDEAIEYLYSHPNVLPGGIGVIGISKGAELALHMATVSEKVKAVVSINSFHYLSVKRHNYHGKTLAECMPDLSALEFKDNAVSFRQGFLQAKNKEENLLPVENAKAWLMFLQGVDDELVDFGSAARLVSRLSEHDYRRFEAHFYPGTGHLLEPPYLAVSPVNYHAVFGVLMDYGGIPEDHSRASEDAWNKILKFFREKIGPTNNIQSHL